MKHTVYILLLIAFFIKVKAQTNPLQQEEFKQEQNQRDKNILLEAKEKSLYIFEGEVIKSEDFYNKSKNDVYTKNTIKISYLFKGELKDSIIELILQPYTYNPDINFGGTLPELRKDLPTGYKGVFYCVKPMAELQKEITNINALQLNRQIAIYFEEKNRTFNGAQYNTLHFETKDDLYKTINFFPPNYKPFVGQEAKTVTKQESEDLIKSKHSKKKGNANNKASVASAITFSFQNMQVTGTVQKYYEFDVSGFGSTNEYLDYVQVDIDYAAPAFGNSVVASSNVTVTQVPAFPATKYPIFLKSDNNTNILRVLMVADLTTPNRLILPTTITTFFHVKMKVICNQNVNLSFGSGTGGAYAATATSTALPTNYSPVNDNDFDGTLSCALSITSFLPPSINGGRGEILTINGNNFGATQGSGYIQLKNANNGGSSFIQLDADDYVSWSNSQIKIRVPSFSRGNGTITALGSPVGNGPIIVSNGTNTFTSVSPLIVFYSRANYGETTGPLPSGFTYRKEKIYATGNPSTTTTSYYGKKFPIKIDSASCAAFPGALACIRKAVKDWICETKIPFVLVGDTAFQSSVPSNGSAQNVLDKVSTIRFSNFALGGIGANIIGQTYSRSRSCDTMFAIKMIGTLPEFDIEFDLNQSWFCDTSTFASKPANMLDFYEVALHELGHADLLKHNNDLQSIMYYSSISTPSVAAGNRKIFINIMDYLGGSQIITDSKNTIYSANCSFLALAPDNACTSTIGIKKNVIDNNDIIVQPNPFNDNLLISINTKTRSVVKLSIFDVLGKTVKTFEENPNVIGEYKIEYNGNELVSGVYFITIQINNEFVIKKIIKQ